jgi:hypothetical protein
MKAKRAVYEIPGMQDVAVRPGVPYRDALTLDLYLPAGGGPKPAVVIVLGYPDFGVPTPFGCQFREMGMIISWAQLFAASGIVGVVYETANPAEDVHAVLACLRANAAEWGIDPSRIGVWASSGNVPVALSALMAGNLRCGVICYGATLDLDGASDVAQAQSQFRFSNPTAGRSVEELPRDTALFIARAGQDQFAGMNSSIDPFLAAAVRCNLPVTFVNHPTGPHAFDLLDDSQTSKHIIQAILAFLQAKLSD